MSKGKETYAYHIEVFRRADRRHDWRIVHQNGNVLATSNQGYETRTGAAEVAQNMAFDLIGCDETLRFPI